MLLRYFRQSATLFKLFSCLALQTLFINGGIRKKKITNEEVTVLQISHIKTNNRMILCYVN